MSHPGKSDGAATSGAAPDVRRNGSEAAGGTKTVFWLQGFTLAWMMVECGLSLYAAMSTKSVALAAFGADSFVELLSAGVVLLGFCSKIAISKSSAARAAGALLFALAALVSVLAAVSLALGLRPETSPMGMGVAAAALVVMPFLAAMKRREAKRRGDAALAADAVQSATCAYLAAVTLTGLAIHAVFRLAWFDPVAALVAVPLLIKEGRAARRGQTCGCC